MDSNDIHAVHPAYVPATALDGLHYFELRSRRGPNWLAAVGLDCSGVVHGDFRGDCVSYKARQTHQAFCRNVRGRSTDAAGGWTCLMFAILIAFATQGLRIPAG